MKRNTKKRNNKKGFAATLAQLEPTVKSNNPNAVDTILLFDETGMATFILERNHDIRTVSEKFPKAIHCSAQAPDSSHDVSTEDLEDAILTVSYKSNRGYTEYTVITGKMPQKPSVLKVNSSWGNRRCVAIFDAKIKHYKNKEDATWGIFYAKNPEIPVYNLNDM